MIPIYLPRSTSTSLYTLSISTTYNDDCTECPARHSFNGYCVFIFYKKLKILGCSVCWFGWCLLQIISNLQEGISGSEIFYVFLYIVNPLEIKLNRRHFQLSIRLDICICRWYEWYNNLCLELICIFSIFQNYVTSPQNVFVDVTRSRCAQSSWF